MAEYIILVGTVSRLIQLCSLRYHNYIKIRLLLAYARCYFEARRRQEAAECWRHLNQAIWPEFCITRLKAFKRVSAKNNSRTKRSNLAKFISWLTFSHISLIQKENYKIKIIPIVSKKARGEPGILTLCTPRAGDVRALDYLLPAFDSVFRTFNSLQRQL